MKDKKKSGRTSGMRIWRAYAVTALTCLCLTALVCGVVTADVNTRTVLAGDGGSVAAGSQKDSRVTLSVDEKTFCFDLPDRLDALTALLPSPVRNIAALPECLAELIAYYI